MRNELKNSRYQHYIKSDEMSVAILLIACFVFMVFVQNKVRRLSVEGAKVAAGLLSGMNWQNWESALVIPTIWYKIASVYIFAKGRQSYRRIEGVRFLETEF